MKRAMKSLAKQRTPTRRTAKASATGKATQRMSASVTKKRKAKKAATPQRGRKAGQKAIAPGHETLSRSGVGKKVARKLKAAKAKLVHFAHDVEQTAKDVVSNVADAVHLN